MGTDGYQTYGGDHFMLYANIKSLCSTSETNIKVCQLYFNKKKKEVVMMGHGCGQDDIMKALQICNLATSQ